MQSIRAWQVGFSAFRPLWSPASIRLLDLRLAVGNLDPLRTRERLAVAVGQRHATAVRAELDGLAGGQRQLGLVAALSDEQRPRFLVEVGRARGKSLTAGGDQQ